MPALTQRDAAAHGLGDVLTLTEARNDYPLKDTKAPVAPNIINYDDEPDHLQMLYAECMNGLLRVDKNGHLLEEALLIFKKINRQWITQKICTKSILNCLLENNPSKKHKAGSKTLLYAV